MAGRRSSPNRWVVPLRRVFPWWFIAGFAATLGLVIATGSGSTSGIGAFWGPAAGIVIAQRQADAASREDDALPLSRRDLVGPAWLEPVITGLLTLLGVGVAVLLGVLFDPGDTRLLITGATFFLVGAAGYATLVLTLRARRHRRARS